MHTAWLTHSLWVSFLVSIHMSYVMDCLAKHKRSGTSFFAASQKLRTMPNSVIDGRTRKDSIRPATGYSAAQRSPYILNVMVSQVVADIAAKASRHDADEETGDISFDDTAEITVDGDICYYVDYSYYLEQRTVVVTEHLGATLRDTEKVSERITVTAVSNGDYEDFNQYVPLLNHRLNK